MQIIEVKNQLVSTIALIDDENNILIGKRPAGKFFENLWEFPGGKVKKNETIEQALIRETKEEIIQMRMKQFDKDILHWKDYNYVIINNDLEDCYKQISEYIDCEINEKEVTYDKDLIKNHIKKLIS